MCWKPAQQGGAVQAVQKAIRAVEKDRRARPVDPREAAKGRLDYVQVKDWGGGAPEDLDAMQVQCMTPSILRCLRVWSASPVVLGMIRT